MKKNVSKNLFPIYGKMSNFQKTPIFRFSFFPSICVLHNLKILKKNYGKGHTYIYKLFTMGKLVHIGTTF